MFEYIVLQANTFEVLGLTYQPVPKLPETREGARSQSVYYYFTRTLQKCTPTIRKISLTSNNLPDFLCCGGGGEMMFQSILSLPGATVRLMLAFLCNCSMSPTF
jgi:hypothetical protein